MKKSKKQIMKDAATRKLLEAAGDYVNSIGGSAIVAGGIGIMHSEDKNKFSIVIKITGKKPPLGENANS